MTNRATRQAVKGNKQDTRQRVGAPAASKAATPAQGLAQGNAAIALTLQRTVGNAAVNRLVQAKLTVGAANDPLEREADRVADRVVSGGTSQAQPAGAQGVHRNAAEEDELMTKRNGMLDSFDAGSDFESKLSSSGGGKPLDTQTRSQMEAGIGADFSNVRVHTGSHSSALNRSISARAFTRGSDVFFDRGQYNPGSIAGKRLIAHELTHVVQQGAASQTTQRKAYPAVAGMALRAIQPRIQRKLYVGGQEMEDVDDDQIAPVDRQNGNVDTNNPEYRQIVGGTKIDNVDTAWQNVLQADPGISNMGWWAKRSMKARLKKWITRSDMLDLRGAKVVNALFKSSDERRYESWHDVAVALAGEEKAKPRKTKEKEIAKKVAKKNSFRRDLGTAMKKIHDYIDTRANADEWWDAIETYKAKFPRWYPRGQVQARMANPVLNRVSSNFIIIHEVMFALAKSGRVNVFAESQKANKQKLGTVNPKGHAKATGKIGAGSGEAQGRHAAIEKNAWVKAARSRNMPLGAGASNTTHLLMTFSGMLNLSATDKKAIAWGAFIFWNKTFYQTEAVRHTFHEIMDVANLATDGEVDYDPDAENPYDVGYNKKGGNPLIVQQIDGGIPVNGDNVTEEQSQEIELPDSAPKDVLPTLDDTPEGKQEVEDDSRNYDHGIFAR